MQKRRSLVITFRSLSETQASPGLSKLNNCAYTLFTWFKENHMKPIDVKCHLLVITEKSVSINIDGSNVKNKEEQKLLGINFDSSLSF